MKRRYLLREPLCTTLLLYELNNLLFVMRRNRKVRQALTWARGAHGGRKNEWRAREKRKEDGGVVAGRVDYQ